MSAKGRKSKARSKGAKERWISAYEALLNRSFVIVSPKQDPFSDQEAPSDDEDVISVTKVDLDIYNNTKEHHTDEFEITDMLDVDMREFLVVRRGQKFNMNIELDRDFKEKKEDIQLVFKFGNDPKESKETHAELLVSEKDVPNEWGAWITSVKANVISLAVMTPPNCPVGIWRLNLDVVKRDNNTTTVFRHVHKDPIYILFNPWCEDDRVYLHETKLLNEYVLNETGRIYRGTSTRITPKSWNFGQFTGDVLDCIIYLLDTSTLTDHGRGDPVLVSRKLSSLINSPDNNGVLTGNWSGNYNGGISPSDWTGSVAILEEFYKSKQPVCYGQCWVFSGVLTTACRALGIPARSVTNFSSAHDTDGSVTIDYHFDHKGEEIGYLNGDSVWNFHVWNDVWMARPELPQGYGGWQAIDATPQETSEGVYRMGPMSLAATKRGDVNQPYDGKFLFAEVNGDKVYWRHDKNDKKTVLHIKKYSIGKNISTKEPFTTSRQDITDQYKYTDGSHEERAAVKSAYKAVEKKDKYPLYQSISNDVTFELVNEEETRLGDTICITLKMTNTSTEKRTVEGTIKLESIYYTGVVHKLIQKRKLSWAVLQANEEKIEKFKIDVDDYLDKLMDHCICKVSCICFVPETKQAYTDSDDISLLKPELVIQAPAEGTVGEKFEVEVSFTNPLPVQLTKCELVVDGAHLQKPIIYKQRNVEKQEKFTGEFEITPKKAGKREFIVSFNCHQIDDIGGSHEIQIKKKQKKSKGKC